MLQLLCNTQAPDFDAWKQKFDADGENLRNAGLSLLQMWREDGHPDRVFCLFRVNDKDKAREYLAGPSESFLTGDEFFLKTV